MVSNGAFILVTMIPMLLVRPRGEVQMYVPDSCCWISLMIRRNFVARPSGELIQAKSTQVDPADKKWAKLKMFFRFACMCTGSIFKWACANYSFDMYDAIRSTSIPGYPSSSDTCSPGRRWCLVARPKRPMAQMFRSPTRSWCVSMVDYRLQKNTNTRDYYNVFAVAVVCRSSVDCFKLPEKLVKSVVGTHDGIRGAHKPFEQSTRVSPSSLYRPRSLQRACNECPCGTSHPTFCRGGNRTKWTSEFIFNSTRDGGGGTQQYECGTIEMFL